MSFNPSITMQEPMAVQLHFQHRAISERQTSCTRTCGWSSGASLNQFNGDVVQIFLPQGKPQRLPLQLAHRPMIENP
jgi:hypothetical protein